MIKRKLKITVFSIDWKEDFWADYRKELKKLEKTYPHFYEVDQGFIDSRIAILSNRKLTDKEVYLLDNDDNVAVLFDTNLEKLEGTDLSDIIKKAQKEIDERQEED
jgi:hypothetical protein